MAAGSGHEAGPALLSGSVEHVCNVQRESLIVLAVEMTVEPAGEFGSFAEGSKDW